MIGKTISTFDNFLPTEEPDKLMGVIDECRKRPDPADLVDFSEERETLEALNIILRGMIQAKRDGIEPEAAQPEPSCMDVLNYWFGEDGSDNTSTGSRRDAGFGESGPF